MDAISDLLRPFRLPSARMSNSVMFASPSMALNSELSMNVLSTGS